MISPKQWVLRNGRKTFYEQAAFAGLAAVAFLLGVFTGAPARAALPKVATTPPMGWNSWLTYGTLVREDEVKAKTDVLADRLKPYDWQYVVVDSQWYEANAQVHGYSPSAR